MKRPLLALFTLLFVLLSHAHAQMESARLSGLENRVSEIERQIRENGGWGVSLILFGIFCAHWAQNTNRSAWLWFFLGALLGPIAGIVLLMKNSNDRAVRLAELLAEADAGP